MSQIPTPRSNPTLRHSGSLTLRAREALQPLLSDVRRDSIRFFIPFTLERSPTGKLLPLVCESTPVPLKKQNSEQLMGNRDGKQVRPPIAFNSKIDKSKSRVVHERFPSPPPGLYTPEPRSTPLPLPMVRKHKPRFRQQHTRVLSLNSIDYDAIIKDRKHIAGVDMAKTLARDKEQMLDAEELLNHWSLKLPDHLRRFKGFYDVSGLKSTGMDRPVVLEQASSHLSNQIKERMSSIRRNVGIGM